MLIIKWSIFYQHQKKMMLHAWVRWITVAKTGKEQHFYIDLNTNVISQSFFNKFLINYNIFLKIILVTYERNIVINYHQVHFF